MAKLAKEDYLRLEGEPAYQELISQLRSIRESLMIDLVYSDNEDSVRARKRGQLQTTEEMIRWLDEKLGRGKITKL